MNAKERSEKRLEAASMRTDPLPAEIKWWSRFKKVVKDMPPGVEVIVGGNGIATLAPRGAVKASLDAGDDAGGACTMTLNSIYDTNLVDGSSGI